MPGTNRLLRPVAAVVAQGRVLLDWFESLDPDDFSRASVCEGWDVRTLLGHLVLMHRGLVDVLDRPSTERPIPAWRFVSRYSDAVDAIGESTRHTTGDHSPGELLGQLAQELVRIEAIGQRTVPDVLDAPRGPLTILDWIRTRTLDIVIHSDDLSRSLPAYEPVPTARPALADAVRVAAEMLADRYPGHSVEVRIPPLVAVQCIEGPRHTRGTPPNVIETDATTFLRLVAGRVSWQDEVLTARVRASGSRASLADELPLLG